MCGIYAFKDKVIYKVKGTDLKIDSKCVCEKQLH